MIDFVSNRSQDDRAGSRWIRRLPVLTALKALAIGVNPRWGTCTVVTSHRTGRVLRIEDRVNRVARVYVSDEPERTKRARIHL